MSMLIRIFVPARISILETVSISVTSWLEQQHTNYIKVIISATDYALYSKLNVSNVSLNIILCDLIAILKATIDLENKLKQRYTLKLLTKCEPTSAFQSVCTCNNVKKV